MVRIASRVALIFWLFTLVLGLVAVGCGGGGDDSPTAPGPGIEDPDPDGGIPGPGPGNGNGGQPGGGIPTTQADVRSGTTAGTGEVTLPGFERAPAGTKGRLPIRYAVFDSQGRPLAGVFITNIRQGGEFLGVIVAPGGDRAPRLFFSERIPDRLGSVEPERGSTVINKNQFGELVSSAMNIARDGDTLVVRITLPREANVNDEVRSDTQRNYFLDNDLADRLLSFGDLVSYRGTFSAGELAGQISNSLQGMGGYVYVAALVQDTNLLSNWRLAPAIATNPNDPTYRQFLEPMLTSTGSEIYWVQQLAVTSGATAGQIQADFNASFPNNPLAVNLGPDQRYLLVELDALKGQTSFTGRVRKLIYVIPLSPRSISLNTADGDGRFRLNQAENLHVTLDYVAGSSIPLGPMPTATAPFGTRVGLTATPIRPGDVVTRPPLAPAVTAVDELQRNVQAFYFIPDFFGDADTYNQGVLGGDCVNCLRSNVLPLVGPNGVVTNLPPRVEVQIVSPTNPSPRLPAAGLPVKVGFDGTSDPDNEIVELVVDWGDDSPDTVVTNATGPINFDTLELTHTYTDAGNRTITATVRDNGTPVSTAANAASLTIIANALPVACLETTPAAVDGVIEGPAPLVITFDVGCSTDPDSNLNAPVNEGGGRISADFGDSVRINNESFALYHRLDRTYFNAGEYNVVFTIIDADGGTDTVEVLVRVLGDEPNMDPVAVAGADVTSGEAPLTVHFMGSGSSDPDGSIVTYIWNFDDGTVPGGGTSTQPNPVYVYQQPGNYNPTLTVIDNE
ncbi:MAG TPA: PKD domain-containing protein, partial [bacterium]|nr:PKD domain-containing protein [bacterium]